VLSCLELWPERAGPRVHWNRVHRPLTANWVILITIA
jgi:hypothetical protein